MNVVYYKDQYLDSFYCFHDLPKITNSETLLFVDDTSVIISNHNITDLEQNTNWVLKKNERMF
jgi:hypothetical protein